MSALEESSTDELLGRLHPTIADWFQKRHATFTEAQRLSIPRILDGENLLLCSPTGTGKTLAGFLGIIHRLIEQRETARLPRGVTALYISPLRALAYDIRKNLEEPLEEMGLRDALKVGVRTGDTSSSERQKFARNPPDIFLTTPESLAIILSQERLLPLLCTVRYVILDEIHAIAESKRGCHLAVTLERLEHLITHSAPGDEPPPRLCRIGLSATVAPVERLAKFLTGRHRPCHIAESGYERQIHASVFSPLRKNPYPPAGWTGSRVIEELAQLIARRRSVLVFCNTRSGAENVGMRLKRSLPDLADNIEVHHGSLDRSVRLDVEDRLKAGELRAVVCSTSLELGIDIGAIDLVVMVAAPKGISRTLQRIGRSGHRIDQPSEGVLVATNINDLVECTVTVRMTKRRQLDPVEIFEHAYDVVAQHVAGLALVGDWKTDDVYALITRAYPFRNLPREEFDHILVYLEGGGRSLQAQYQETFGRIRVDDGVIRAVENTRRRRDYLMNVGAIPSEGAVDVRLNNRGIGSVEEMFIKKLNIGDVFVLAGKTLKLVSTGVMEARVEHVPHLQPTVPSWNAAKMPLTSGLAREVTRVRTRLEDLLVRENRSAEDVADWLVETFELSLSNANAITRHFQLQAKYSVIPVENRLLIEVFEEDGLLHYFFHSLIGRSANDALSRILAFRVKNRVGGNAMVTIDDYGFLLTLQEFQRLDLDDWKSLFTPEAAGDDLEDALRDSELVKWQFRGVAQTGLMVPRQMPGGRGERRLKQLRWSGEILFQVLQRHEPDHPLLRQAFYEAMHTFLNAPAAVEYLENVADYEWILREVTAVTPFSFGIYVSKIKESMMLEDPEAAIERLFRTMYEKLERDG